MNTADRNKTISGVQTGVAATGASLSWIPFAGPIIAGASAATAGLLELAKKRESIGVSSESRNALAVSSANMNRISNLDGLTQGDFAKISEASSKVNETSFAAVNSMPQMSLLDRQHISDFLMSGVNKTQGNMMDLVSQLDENAAAQNATATAQASASTANISNSITESERMEQQDKEQANAALMTSISNGVESFAQSFGKMLDLLPQDGGSQGSQGGYGSKPIGYDAQLDKSPMIEQALAMNNVLEANMEYGGMKDNLSLLDGGLKRTVAPELNQLDFGKKSPYTLNANFDYKSMSSDMSLLGDSIPEWLKEN